MTNLAIYGYGGFGKEVKWLLTDQIQNAAVNFLGYIDDTHNPQDDSLYDEPHYTLDSFTATHPNAHVIVSMANTAVRQKVAHKCLEAGLSFYLAVDSRVRISDSLSLGTGSVICAGCQLTVDIVIGEHTHINLNCTVGHDVRVGNFVTVAPGVHISGNVTIEDHVTIGTGATIINGGPGNPIVICAGAVIGAGACVVKSIEQPGVYVGVPARRIS